MEERYPVVPGKSASVPITYEEFWKKTFKCSSGKSSRRFSLLLFCANVTVDIGDLDILVLLGSRWGYWCKKIITAIPIDCSNYTVSSCTHCYFPRSTWLPGIISCITSMVFIQPPLSNDPKPSVTFPWTFFCIFLIQTQCFLILP